MKTEHRTGRPHRSRTDVYRMRTLRQRRVQYTPVRPPLNPAGRIVIVVDNGIATGASMLAALRLVRTK